MGIRLMVEVLDHAPPELTPAERLLLVAIAEEARDTDRQAAPGIDKLVRRTGLTETSLRHALQRLRGRGFEVRMPIGIDGRGRPIFAANGHRTQYQIPLFAALRRPQEATFRRPQEATIEVESRPGEAAFAPGRRPQEATITAGKAASEGRPSPKSKDLLLQQAAKVVKDNTDATGPESERVVGLIQVEKSPRNLVGFLVNLSRTDGELQLWVDQLRAGQRHGDRQEWLDHLAGLPACEHGTAGGDVPDATGWVLCPVCRRRRAANAA